MTVRTHTRRRSSRSENRRHAGFRTSIAALPYALAALTVAWFLAAYAAPVRAAEGDARAWVTTAASLPLSDELTANLAVQARVRDDVSDLERVVLRPWIGFTLSSALRGALGYDAHFIESPGDSVEHRAWQQLSFTDRASAMTPNLRFRLEERFIDGTDGTPLRARLRFAVKRPLETGPWSIAVNNELFWNLTNHSDGPDSGFDQNRFFFGFERSLGDSVGLSVGYLNQYVERGSAPDAVNHILALAFKLAP